MNSPYLPTEIRTHIFGFLGIADRRELAQVSTDWYVSSLDPILYTNTRYVFDASILEMEGNSKRSFQCKCPNVILFSLDENLNVSSLLAKDDDRVSIVGPHVDKLTIRLSNILERSFIEILKRCESLSALSLSGCNSLFMLPNFLKTSDHYDVVESVLKSCKELNLASIRQLTDNSLGLLINACPQLTSLSLASCNIHFSGGYSPMNSLTFNCIAYYIQHHSCNITRLDFSRTSFTSKALRTLIKIDGLKLKELLLLNCRELCDEDISFLCKFQQTLEVIDLGGCYELTNISAVSIANNLPQITTIGFQKCRMIRDNGVRSLVACRKLYKLNISECYDVTMNCVHEVMRKVPSLTILHFTACNMMSFDKARHQKSAPIVSEEVYQPAPVYLKELKIPSAQNLNGRILKTMFGVFTNVEYLDLSWTSFVTDNDLLGLPQDMRELPAKTELMKHIANEGIGQMNRLHTLILGKICGEISNRSLFNIFGYKRFFPHLHTLNLDMLGRAVDDDLIKALISTCPLLRDLSLTSCILITDKGIAHLPQLPRLEKLNLSICDGITHRSLLTLKKLTKKWLHELDLSACKNIPYGKVDILRRECTSVTKIHMRYTGDGNLIATL